MVRKNTMTVSTVLSLQTVINHYFFAQVSLINKVIPIIYLSSVTTRLQKVLNMELCLLPLKEPQAGNTFSANHVRAWERITKTGLRGYAIQLPGNSPSLNTWFSLPTRLSCVPGYSRSWKEQSYWKSIADQARFGVWEIPTCEATRILLEWLLWAIQFFSS